MEEQRKYYYTLGRILYKYYNGEHLSSEELEEIARASKEDYAMALDFNAMERLSKRTDRSFSHFIKNKESLNVISYELKNNIKNKSI